MKVTRKTLINYLKKRYTPRVATKMACIFDWSNQQLEFDPFYQRIEASLLQPKDLSNKENYAYEHVRLLKKFAF